MYTTCDLCRIFQHCCYTISSNTDVVGAIPSVGSSLGSLESSGSILSSLESSLDSSFFVLSLPSTGISYPKSEFCVHSEISLSIHDMLWTMFNLGVRICIACDAGGKIDDFDFLCLLLYSSLIILMRYLFISLCEVNFLIRGVYFCSYRRVVLWSSIC